MSSDTTTRLTRALSTQEHSFRLYDHRNKGVQLPEAELVLGTRTAVLLSVRLVGTCLIDRWISCSYKLMWNNQTLIIFFYKKIFFLVILFYFGLNFYIYIRFFFFFKTACCVLSLLGKRKERLFMLLSNVLENMLLFQLSFLLNDTSCIFLLSMLTT